MDIILRQWNIFETYEEKITDTAWNVGNSYVLKEYSDKKSLDRNIKFLKELDKNNIPIAQIVPQKDGPDYVAENGKYYLLTKKLEGKNAVSIREWDGMPFEMGKIIGKLHIAFLKINIDDEIWRNSLLDEMQGWIYDNFEKDEWQNIDKIQYETTLSNLKKYYHKLPNQLIHRDVHFGNFLFSDGKFSGYIDFDLSQTNIRIFDVCYFLLGLLVEEENHMSADEWRNTVKEAIAGYNSVIPLTNAEYYSIPYVMQCIEILFISYSLGENDAESLQSSKKLYNMLLRNEKNLISLFSDKSLFIE